MKKTFVKFLTVLMVLTMAVAGLSAQSVDMNVNGSKTASETALTYSKDTSTITLSLPAGEALREVDVVFVMDASSSTQVVDGDFATMATNMLQEISAKNVIANVGVIKVRGVAMDCIYETTSDKSKMIPIVNGDPAAVEIVKNAINFNAKSTLKAGYVSSGTNLHAGLVLADKWLSADTKVANEDKYVFFLTDGKTYIWDENGQATSIYAQWAKHFVIQDNGEAKINQTYNQDKGIYNVGDVSQIVSFNTVESGSGAEIETLRYNNFMKLYNSTNAELTQSTKYDTYCYYAYGQGGSLPGGAVYETHPIANARERNENQRPYIDNGYDVYYDFRIDGKTNDDSSIHWQEGNPYEIVTKETDNGVVYEYDFTKPNPDFYQYHVANLEKATYKTAHKWADMTAKYNTIAAVYQCAISGYCAGWGQGGGLGISCGFDTWMLRTSDYSADVKVSNSVSRVFNNVKQDILYMVARGTVTDVMGEKFDVVANGANTFRIAVGGEELPVVAAGENTWNYGTPVDNVYPYVLTYTPGAEEKYTLQINVPVENSRPLTIKYDVTPTDKSTSFDPSEANASAKLDYVSTTGETGTYTFPKPMISYSRKYKLTVNYKFKDGSRAANSVVKEFEAGDNYKVNSPTIKNYVANMAVVSGQMPAADKTIDVIYSPTTPAVVTKLYKLTINYLYEDGTVAAEKHESQVENGKSYSVVSPQIEGFTPDFAVVEGTMPSTDISFDVIYKKSDTPVETMYEVVIEYVYEDGKEAHQKYTEKFLPGAQFTVVSAEIEGYKPDVEVVTGTVEDKDLYYKVTYAKLEDIIDPNTPLIGGSAWSLFNLMCACGTGLQAVVLLFKKLKKTDDEEKQQMTKQQVEKVEDEEKDEKKRLNFSKLTSAINTALGAELFVMTENMKLPMVFFDKWSPIMATLLIAQIGVMIIAKKKEREEDKKKKEEKK